MKIIKIIVFPVAFLFAVACGNEEQEMPDYRDAWVGTYDYVVESYGWSPIDSYSYPNDTGRIDVLAVDSCYICMKLQSDTSKKWLCRVALRGDLYLVDGQYRQFGGLFFGTDSLKFHCANFSPGAGSAWTYWCKKVVKQQ